MMHTCPSPGILNNLQSTTIIFDFNSNVLNPNKAGLFEVLHVLRPGGGGGHYGPPPPKISAVKRPISAKICTHVK